MIKKVAPSFTVLFHPELGIQVECNDEMAAVPLANIETACHLAETEVYKLRQRIVHEHDKAERARLAALASEGEPGTPVEDQAVPPTEVTDTQENNDAAVQT